MTRHTTDEAELVRNVDVADKDVVDVGAGEGHLVRWLRTRGARPTGVECGEVMIDRARALDAEHGDDYIDAVAQDLPMSDESVDVVTFIYSLHHVPGEEMRNALAEAFRVLRPGGTLYVAEPVATGPGHEVDRLIDDETLVREQAQAALRDCEQLGFERRTTGGYSTWSIYADFEAYESMMVGIDPGRAAAMELRRDEARERFEANAIRSADGYAFDNPCVYDVMSKPLTR